LIGDIPDVVEVYGLPWIEAAEYATGAVSPLPVTLAWLASMARQAKARGLGAVLVAHAEIAGYATEAGHSPAGRTRALSSEAWAEALGDAFDYIALGHIHRRQSWLDGRLAYCGSPDRNNFGEPEEKGWNLVTLHEDFLLPTVEFRPLPARRIVLLEGGPDRENVRPGDLVRLRLRVAPEALASVDREALRASVLALGAADCKVEVIVEHAVRVRSDEIAAAKTTWDKVLAYFRARPEAMPDDAAIERLRAKLDEIEREGEQA
jgi:DNA repair exonuclease SbcCD nuclease subunit